MTDIDKPSEQIAENANCSIAKLAEELAAKVCAPNKTPFDLVATGTRLGILEGMKLQRERDAAIAENEIVEIYDDTPNETDATCNAIVLHIAAAIRSAL